MPEIKVKDTNNEPIGNIDGVLIGLDSDGNVMEDKFGLIELQSVYVSGNIRNPFRWFMEDQDNRGSQNYSGNNYPKPDYLSSSRKRLFPQVQYKYNAFANSGNSPKFSIVIDKPFWDSMGDIPTCNRGEADIQWIILEAEITENGASRLRLNSLNYSKWEEIVDQRLNRVLDRDFFLEQCKRKLETNEEFKYPRD